jgi:hypothetical protein
MSEQEIKDLFDTNEEILQMLKWEFYLLVQLVLLVVIYYHI